MLPGGFLFLETICGEIPTGHYKKPLGSAEARGSS